MAASVPVIALDDPAFNEVIANDLNGFLFKDRKEYVDIMLKLSKDKELVNRLSVQARNTAESHSSKYFAEKVLDVYKIALKGRKRKKGKRSFWSRMVSVFKTGLRK